MAVSNKRIMWVIEHWSYGTDEHDVANELLTSRRLIAALLHSFDNWYDGPESKLPVDIVKDISNLRRLLPEIP